MCWSRAGPRGGLRLLAYNMGSGGSGEREEGLSLFKGDPEGT